MYVFLFRVSKTIHFLVKALFFLRQKPSLAHLADDATSFIARRESVTCVNVPYISSTRKTPAK